MQKRSSEIQENASFRLCCRIQWIMLSDGNDHSDVKFDDKPHLTDCCNGPDDDDEKNDVAGGDSRAHARRDDHTAGHGKRHGSHGVHGHGSSLGLGRLRDPDHVLDRDRDLCLVRVHGHVHVHVRGHGRGRSGEGPRDCATCALSQDPTACSHEGRRAEDREVGQGVGQGVEEGQRRGEAPVRSDRAEMRQRASEAASKLAAGLRSDQGIDSRQRRAEKPLNRQGWVGSWGALVAQSSLRSDRRCCSAFASDQLQSLVA